MGDHRSASVVFILGRRQLVKLRVAIAAGCIDPVNRQAMEMRVAIQSISPALHKRHDATLRGANTKQFVSAPPQFTEQSANENVQGIAREARVKQRDQWLEQLKEPGIRLRVEWLYQQLDSLRSHPGRSRRNAKEKPGKYWGNFAYPLECKGPHVLACGNSNLHKRSCIT